MGDERLTKSPFFSHQMVKGSRTGAFENQKEFSQAPAPSYTWPPDPERKSPAIEGTIAGPDFHDQLSRQDQKSDSTTQLAIPTDLRLSRLKCKVALDAKGCWAWQGYRDRNGYGRTKFDGKQQQAHRVIYTLAIGPIPAGMYLHHLCLNTSCCNPLHLDLVTPQENTRRNLSPPSCNARKTRCDHGDPFDTENTYLQGGKRRQCRACNREAVRQYNARKKGGA